VKAIRVELGDRLCFAYRHFPLTRISHGPSSKKPPFMA
jgi:hypothetical protein